MPVITAPLHTPIYDFETLLGSGFAPSTSNADLTANAKELMALGGDIAATYPVVNDASVGGGYLAGVNRSCNQLISDIASAASSSVIEADVSTLLTDALQLLAGCLATDLVNDVKTNGCPAPTDEVEHFQAVYTQSSLTPTIPSVTSVFDTATAAAAAAASGTALSTACAPTVTPTPVTSPPVTTPITPFPILKPKPTPAPVTTPVTTTPAASSSGTTATAIVATVGIAATASLGFLAYKMSTAAKAAQIITRR